MHRRIESIEEMGPHRDLDDLIQEIINDIECTVPAKLQAE